jgi:hypothetical protein
VIDPNHEHRLFAANQPPLATERTSGQGCGIAPGIDWSRPKGDATEVQDVTDNERAK